MYSLLLWWSGLWSEHSTASLGISEEQMQTVRPQGSPGCSPFKDTQITPVQALCWTPWDCSMALSPPACWWGDWHIPWQWRMGGWVEGGSLGWHSLVQVLCMNEVWGIYYCPCYRDEETEAQMCRSLPTQNLTADKWWSQDSDSDSPVSQSYSSCSKVTFII